MRSLKASCYSKNRRKLKKGGWAYTAYPKLYNCHQNFFKSDYLPKNTNQDKRITAKLLALKIKLGKHFSGDYYCNIFRGFKSQTLLGRIFWALDLAQI